MGDYRGTTRAMVICRHRYAGFSARNRWRSAQGAADPARWSRGVSGQSTDAAGTNGSSRMSRWGVEPTAVLLSARRLAAGNHAKLNTVVSKAGPYSIRIRTVSSFTPPSRVTGRVAAANQIKLRSSDAHSVGRDSAARETLRRPLKREGCAVDASDGEEGQYMGRYAIRPGDHRLRPAQAWHGIGVRLRESNRRNSRSSS